MRSKSLIMMISVLVGVSLLSAPILCDTIKEGKKSIDWRYEITNLDEYSDYFFLLENPHRDLSYRDKDPTAGPSKRITKTFSFYYNGNPSIYAMKKQNIIKSN